MVELARASLALARECVSARPDPSTFRSSAALTWAVPERGAKPKDDAKLAAPPPPTVAAIRSMSSLDFLRTCLGSGSG